MAAIIDWGQSGWYPAYREYCKARCVGLGMGHPDFNRAFQEEWWAKYILVVLDPVDEKMRWHPWLFFVLSLGC